MNRRRRTRTKDYRRLKPSLAARRKELDIAATFIFLESSLRAFTCCENFTSACRTTDNNYQTIDIKTPPGALLITNVKCEPTTNTESLKAHCDNKQTQQSFGPSGDFAPRENGKRFFNHNESEAQSFMFPKQKHSSLFFRLRGSEGH